MAIAALALGAALAIGGILFIGVATFIDLTKDGHFTWATPLAATQLVIGLILIGTGITLLLKARGTG